MGTRGKDGPAVFVLFEGPTGEEKGEKVDSLVIERKEIGGDMDVSNN